MIDLNGCTLRIYRGDLHDQVLIWEYCGIENEASTPDRFTFTNKSAEILVDTDISLRWKPRFFQLQKGDFVIRGTVGPYGSDIVISSETNKKGEILTIDYANVSL